MRREDKPVTPTISFGERNRLYFPSLSTPVPWKVKASVQRASGTYSEPVGAQATRALTSHLKRAALCSIHVPGQACGRHQQKGTRLGGRRDKVGPELWELLETPTPAGGAAGLVHRLTLAPGLPPSTLRAASTHRRKTKCRDAYR